MVQVAKERDQDIGSVLNDVNRPLKERFRALFTLRNIGGKNSINCLNDCFGDESALLKHELTYCLGQMQDPSAIPLLVRVFEDIDWLRALAIHLWYLSSPTSSITDALIAYESSFQSTEFYAVPPSPAYIEKYQTKIPKPIYDIRYHILKLYSKRSHPLESLLNPATHTPDSMDFRLSWLLLQTFETLGYHHCSELAETQIHVTFANQLENQNMWHWAIFVLLHIKDRNRRETCIQELLYRYVDISNDASYVEREKFIVNDLGIPEKWIFWSKAVKAGAQRSYHEQAKFLLRAKQWSLAHEVIMAHIAPDAIINDNVPYLHELLRQFEDPRQVSNFAHFRVIHRILESSTQSFTEQKISWGFTFRR